jgi:hypothetical protein
MAKVSIKNDEMVLHKDDFGFLVEEFIRGCLRPHNCIHPEWLDTRLREWWPKLEEYYQRHIISAIEVAIALDEPSRSNREPMEPLRKFMWQKIVADLRSPRSAFTIDYHCHKCKTKNVKLWRGVHGCADKNGHELLCATCLAPGIPVNKDGRWRDPDMQIETDQVKGWLPAVPVGDTYWGYSSVPSQDLEWWLSLPTYIKNDKIRSTSTL